MLNVKQEANKRQRLMEISSEKRPMEIKPVKTELTVEITRAFKIIDDRTFSQLGGYELGQKKKKPNHEGQNFYRVVAWTTSKEDRLYETDVVKTYKTRSCNFDEKLKIPLEDISSSSSNPYRKQYLYVELRKGSAYRDPGTSKKYVVIGRGRVRLPDRPSRRTYSYDVSLLGLNRDRRFVDKAVLDLSMKLRRFEV